MKFNTHNKMNLIPIGDISFRFNKSTSSSGTTIYVSDLHILCETDRNITPDTEKKLLKIMKKAKTDLLTDGHDFYTTRGTVVTQIKHPLFKLIKEQHKKEINELLFG